MLCYLHCYHSIFFRIDHTRCQKLKFTGAASIKRSDSPAAQNTTDLQNAEKRWTADELREALLLHLEKPSAAPLLNLQFTFLSSLGCTKCQKDRKWRFFTVWELNSYWCKDWSWTSTKRWNHSLFQRGKGLVCFQYNLKPITLSNACILRDGKRTLDDPYVIFLHLWIEKQWLVHILYETLGTKCSTTISNSWKFGYLKVIILIFWRQKKQKISEKFNDTLEMTDREV